jgi:hypothetical protein
MNPSPGYASRVEQRPETPTGLDESAARRGPAGLDTSVPNVARIYDYILGGKDNFEADRQAARRLLELVPAAHRTVWENRKFLGRAVRYLAGEAGIDQFLDVGVGLPTQGAVHEIARQLTPRARVAYVDYDPVVVSHGQALLAEHDLSVTVRGDVRDPAAILADPGIRDHLDFGRPVAVMLVAILHFVSSGDGPARIVATFRDALPPGSYLVISHVSADRLTNAEAGEDAQKLYERASDRVYPRTRQQILEFFEGLELVEPGLVAANEWRPDAGGPAAGPADLGWAGIGRKG